MPAGKRFENFGAVGRRAVVTAERAQSGPRPGGGRSMNTDTADGVLQQPGLPQGDWSRAVISVGAGRGFIVDGELVNR